VVHDRQPCIFIILPKKVLFIREIFFGINVPSHHLKEPLCGVVLNRSMILKLQKVTNFLYGSHFLFIVSSRRKLSRFKSCNGVIAAQLHDVFDEFFYNCSIDRK